MKIHCIEGLFSYYTRPLTKAVQSLNLGAEVVTYPWTVKEISIADGDAVCVHSFGQRLLEKILIFISRRGYKVNVFVIDGRTPPWGTPYKGVMPYSASVRLWNYYQTNFVRGYPIEGAENREIKHFSHYRMPRNPAFLFKLMEVVKSAKN